MVSNALHKHDEAIKILDVKMKGKRGLGKDHRNMFLNSLRNYNDLEIVAGKPVLNKKFYAHFSEGHKLDALTDGGKEEKMLYKFFAKLKKLGLIHQRSANFPKALSIVSLNPNIASLYRVSLSHISKYTRAKSHHYDNIEGMRIDMKIAMLYTDLRLFQMHPLYHNELRSVKSSDIFFFDDDHAMIYLERDTVVRNTIAPYQLINIRGHKTIELLQEICDKQTSCLFSDNSLEEHFKNYQNKYFGTLPLSAIHMTRVNGYVFHNSPLAATLASNRNVASPVTLSELNALFPNKISDEHLHKEAQRVLQAISRPDMEDVVLESERELFSIEEFTKLQDLLKTKTSSEFRLKVVTVKSELNKYIDDSVVSDHVKLIAKYILYLFDRYEKKAKMAASTIKNYIGLLNKHLFSKVEDLSNVQSHELNEILFELERLRYKQKSIRKIRALISTFLTLSNSSHKLNSINLSSYPKSLIYEHEIDQILDFIEGSFLGMSLRQGVRHRFRILQTQSLLLLGFYTGLRKSELRTRLLSDMYIYGSKLCIDVNKKGLKKLDLRLKTSNAKRRVCTEILNERHMSIIKEFLEIRKKINNKSPFLFLRISKNNIIRSKAVDESVFDDITMVLQSLTGRYVSFHSLRHSYATYEAKKILYNADSNPYALIDLSVRMGHESPETTLKVYTHRSVLDLGGV